MTPDEANDLIYDLIEAVRMRETNSGRFIQHHKEVNRISDLISHAMIDTGEKKDAENG